MTPKHILVGDIGGTNANFAVMDLDGKEIVYRERRETKKTGDFTALINEILDGTEDELKPRAGCFAAAGPLTQTNGRRRISLTNADQVLDEKEIVSATGLDDVLLMNDFMAAAFAVNLLEENDYVILNKGRGVEHGLRAVIGPGTGLGKAILPYNKQVKTYLPLPSEGGHADLPLLTGGELELAEHIKRKHGLTHPLNYENVLSGQGLEDLYEFLRTINHPGAPKGLTAAQISDARNGDHCANETFELFAKFLARCARNFALDTLCTGGLYIAGGIAARNRDSFSTFHQEFIKNNDYRHILERIPIKLITNPDISLKGCALAFELMDHI